MALSGKKKQWVEFVSRYYADADFAQQVDADPTGEMRKAGINLPAGKQVKLVKNTDEIVHCVLPSTDMGKLSEEELSAVFGGDDSCEGYSCDYSCAGNE